MKQVISARASGILLHVSSLPGPHGIGDIGHAIDFIDFLAEAGQSYWQILPVGPTSPVFGNSPYMSYAAFAGNPQLISPELIVAEGYLMPAELAAPEFSPYFVEFERVAAWKESILALACQRFRSQLEPPSYSQFCRETHWLDDYCLFMALREKFGRTPWYDWPEPYRCAERQALLAAREELAERVSYYRFEQYLFHRQWLQLRAHAAARGVRIIGDLPIYVAADSADVWANQQIFDLHPTTRRPVHVAGVPPDYFSRTGQRWGNPLYRWATRKETVKRQLYDWWEARLAAIFSLVDVIRIDHFRGFESYWSLRASEETAEMGAWKKGPGFAFFDEMRRRLGELPVIAEDLGYITPEVEALRDRLGYPGMKILQFAFDGGPDHPYLPFNFNPNCVVFTGTHDNDTTVGWYLDPTLSRGARDELRRLLNKGEAELEAIHRHLIFLAFSSVAALAIIPMQDILGFGNDCRMNTPGTTQGNWVWRCAPEYFNREVSDWLREQTKFFNRLAEHGKSDAGDEA